MIHGKQAATVPQVDSHSGNTNVHLPVKHDLLRELKDTGNGITLSDACSLAKAMKP